MASRKKQDQLSFILCHEADAASQSAKIREKPVNFGQVSQETPSRPSKPPIRDPLLQDIVPLAQPKENTKLCIKKCGSKYVRVPEDNIENQKNASIPTPSTQQKEPLPKDGSAKNQSQQSNDDVASVTSAKQDASATAPTTHSHLPSQSLQTNLNAPAPPTEMVETKNAALVTTTNSSVVRKTKLEQAREDAQKEFGGRSLSEIKRAPFGADDPISQPAKIATDLSGSMKSRLRKAEEEAKQNWSSLGDLAAIPAHIHKTKLQREIEERKWKTEEENRNHTPAPKLFDPHRTQYTLLLEEQLKEKPKMHSEEPMQSQNHQSPQGAVHYPEIETVPENTQVLNEEETEEEEEEQEELIPNDDSLLNHTNEYGELSSLDISNRSFPKGDLDLDLLDPSSLNVSAADSSFNADASLNESGSSNFVEIVMTMGVKELREMLKNRNLKVSGLKQQLQDRLIEDWKRSSHNTQ